MVDPTTAEAYYAHALELMAAGNWQAAGQTLQAAIESGDRAEYFEALAIVYKRQERLPEAIRACEEALRRNPELANTHYNLGNIHRQQGDHALAARAFERAIAIHAGHAHAWAALGQVTRSPQHLRRALELLPDDVGLACDLAEVYAEQGQVRKAGVLYDYAAARQPDWPRVWYGSGCTALAGGNFAAAVKHFQKATALAPSWLEARHNLARSLYELGHVSSAWAEFNHCAESGAPGSEHAQAMLAVIAPGVPEVGHQTVLNVRRRWMQSQPSQTVDRRLSPRQAGCLRIGYVSSFFHQDNWMKPVWALINQQDRRKFTVHLFSDAPAAAIRHGYRPAASDRYFDTSLLSNDELADLVQKCGIDVLVDLNGYSNIRRLAMFRQRLAPVVMAWFNLYATSGFEAIDYLIGDEHVVFEDEEIFYTEKILRVRGSYLAFEVNYPVPEVMPRESGAGFVFGSLVSQYKMTDEVVASWSRILAACPAARLFIKNRSLAVTDNREHLLQRFERCQISRNRLDLEGPEDHYEFLKAYGKMDLALDAFPYNGGTTTTEAIWQGVPVLTFSGDRWASRTSASILKAAGLANFVANTQAQFEEYAVYWGNSPHSKGQLLRIRENMRSRLKSSTICNIPSFAMQIERLLKHCLL